MTQHLPPTNQPRPKGISVELPKDLKAVYANIAFISHTLAELVVDFAQILPRTQKGVIVSRVILSPIHAKLLQNALAQNLATFEKQFGEIKLPSQQSLADQLFRFPPPGQGQDPEDETPDGEE